MRGSCTRRISERSTLGQPAAIAFQIHELQRIGGSQVAVVLPPTTVQQQAETGAGVNPEMKAAAGANVPVGLQVFFPDNLAATLALGPQSLGADALFLGGFQRFLLFSDRKSVV